MSGGYASDDVWRLLVGQHDATNNKIKLYVDNVLKQETAFPDGGIQEQNSLRIGLMNNYVGCERGSSHNGAGGSVENEPRRRGFAKHGATDGIVERRGRVGL